MYNYIILNGIVNRILAALDNESIPEDFNLDISKSFGREKNEGGGYTNTLYMAFLEEPFQ